MTDLHLARIRLNPASRDVQRDLADAKQLHTTLMRLLPDRLGPEPRRLANLLFRVETDQTGTTVLAQATHPLDPGRLPTGYGRSETKTLTPMLAALTTGLRVRYRIDVNPTKSEPAPATSGGKRPRGTVRALSGPEADAWWHKRASTCGLAVETAVPTKSAWPPRPGRNRRDAIRISLWRYDGTATVTDPETLRRALTEGIGRGKPYGAGLLSLLPERPGRA